MPGIFIETFIGVRVPKCHAFTKELYKTKDDETVKERNKTIQKAQESYRIAEEQKAYLLGLKR